MEEGLSINNIDVTNEDVVITYTPSSYITKYSYKIIKNNEYGTPTYINSNTPTNIVLNKTGTYKLEITTTDSYGRMNIITSGEYKIDKEAPVINIKEKTFTITSKEKFDYMDSITASDMVDGDITKNIQTNKEDLDFSKEGIKKLVYSVSDKAGNKTEETIYITVKKDSTELIRIGQVSIAFITVLLLVLLYKYFRSIKFEKRFSKYTINSSKNNSISLFDILYHEYIKIIDKMSLWLSKSVFVKKQANRYSKYVESFDLKDDSTMKFMARKILVGIAYLFIAVVAKLFKSTIIEPYEMVIPFIIGFYTLDVIYKIKYINYKKKIENDMLEAITVMNNAFKSGRSIIQAVDLVSNELDGPICREFKKISMELSFGLDVEVAFKRFADRIKIKEAVYLTSSLSVLNRTGGNIIKVFDSIEKTLFSRKKLNVEMKSLTGSSKMIMYVLMLVPIVFVIFISIINRGYFEPLFGNTLGLLLIGIMLIIYITYIIVVRRVMKVRM